MDKGIKSLILSQAALAGESYSPASATDDLWMAFRPVEGANPLSAGRRSYPPSKEVMA